MNESAVQKKFAKPLILLATLIWGSSFFVMKNTPLASVNVTV